MWQNHSTDIHVVPLSALAPPDLRRWAPPEQFGGCIGSVPKRHADGSNPVCVRNYQAATVGPAYGGVGASPWPGLTKGRVVVQCCTTEKPAGACVVLHMDGRPGSCGSFDTP